MLGSDKDTCVSVVSVVQRVKREQFAFDVIEPSSIPAFVKVVLASFFSHHIPDQKGINFQ